MQNRGGNGEGETRTLAQKNINTDSQIDAWSLSGDTCIVQNKVLEQLDQDIQAGKDFGLQARRREAGLEGSLVLWYDPLLKQEAVDGFRVHGRNP